MEYEVGAKILRIDSAIFFVEELKKWIEGNYIGNPLDFKFLGLTEEDFSRLFNATLAGTFLQEMDRINLIDTINRIIH